MYLSSEKFKFRFAKSLRRAVRGVINYTSGELLLSYIKYEEELFFRFNLTSEFSESALQIFTFPTVDSFHIQTGVSSTALETILGIYKSRNSFCDVLKIL